VSLTLTDVGPRRIAATGSGDLAGTGTVEVRSDAASTALVIRWDVVTRRRWMNATAPVLRPAFAFAHALVMRAGERGLRRALE
jgi:hypothetical protein